MLPLTPHSYYLTFSYTVLGLSQGINKGSTIRTCIDEFEVRYSTIELYPYTNINLSLSPTFFPSLSK